MREGVLWLDRTSIFSCHRTGIGASLSGRCRCTHGSRGALLCFSTWPALSVGVQLASAAAKAIHPARRCAAAGRRSQRWPLTAPSARSAVRLQRRPSVAPAARSAVRSQRRPLTAPSAHSAVRSQRRPRVAPSARSAGLSAGRSQRWHHAAPSARSAVRSQRQPLAAPSALSAVRS